MPLVTMKVKKEALERYEAYIDRVFGRLPALFREESGSLGLGNKSVIRTQVELMKFDRVQNGPDVWIKVEFTEDFAGINIDGKFDPKVLEKIRDRFWWLLKNLTKDVETVPDDVAIDLFWSPGRRLIMKDGSTEPVAIW